ncbi:MAG: VWA domain-containing protein [Acidobacteria bacterium]|nr:VWA domain-containing protein [Acidobacteriota bacterium]
MRKIAAFLLLLSLFVVYAQAGKTQTRARRVGQTTSAPPAPATSSRPPVLGGAATSNTSSSPSQTSSAPASDDAEEEVGEGDVLRVSTTLVTVPVSVMDRAGKYAPDLRQGDFRIFEDNVEQQVAYFASVEKPFTVALVIDMSGSTRFKVDEIQDAALAFIDQLRADDRVMVVSFNDDIKVLAEPTSDRNVLRNAIRRARPGDGTKLYDTIDMVINQRFNRLQGRKAIVLFTDGVDTTSKRASYQSTIRDAEELDALIYPVQYDTYQDMQAGGGGGGSTWPGSRRGSGSTAIDILIGILGNGGATIGRGGGGGGGGMGTSRSDYERANSYLRDLAEKTGARGYRADSVSNISQSFALIAEELRRQYSLGYYPKTGSQAGQRRQIRVRVNRPGLIVRARDSYISTGASGSATAQDDAQQQQRPVLRRGPFVSQH